MAKFPVPEEQSMFNAGIAKLKRIDDLKKKIHIARETNQFAMWYNNLCGWREEMCERMDATQEVEADKYEKTIRLFLGTKYEDLILTNLKKYGIFLSKLEYKFGFSMPDKDSASHALK